MKKKNSFGGAINQPKGRSHCNQQANVQIQRKRQDVPIEQVRAVNIQNIFKYTGDMGTLDYPDLDTILASVRRQSRG